MDRKRERELVEAAQRGDTRAFAALYRAYVDKIYRYILYRVDTAETAEDLTSDVFVRVLEGLPSFQYRAVPLLVWLYRIAHDRVIDHYRRSKRSQRDEPIDELELSSDDDDLDAPLLAQYDTKHILGAIRSLTDTQRQVIVFRFVEGYNLENTARLMDKTVDAVKAMQYRALQALGKSLKEQGYRRPNEGRHGRSERRVRRR